VQAADQGVQFRDAGEALRVPHDVDGPSMPAAGEHDQAAAT
jgi:hypothetical protein